jgi:hypothetical protein
VYTRVAKPCCTKEPSSVQARESKRENRCTARTRHQQAMHKKSQLRSAQKSSASNRLPLLNQEKRLIG